MDVYTIPPNFAQEGTILSGRVRFRNAFEAGFLGLFLLRILLSMTGSTGREPDFFFVPVYEVSEKAQGSHSPGWEIQAEKKPQASEAENEEPERRRKSWETK